MSAGDAPPDAALARRAAEGDERAFSELVRRHKEPLYRLLRRYTGDADDAYEAAHEAFIAAWLAIGRYDPSRSFLAWLRTIAINKARDRGRRASFRRLLFGSEGLDGHAALAQPDPGVAADDTVILGQQIQVLDHAIARLPAPLKEALLLTAFDGWSQAEAGDILGVSAKTIETRVYRARKILAGTLDPELRPKA
ncbi:RNA polymerase sigma factor [Phenylobacterium aquaticum]|uniref:RNA polymerase sigma factor n=1 Tax=Phenylobacterium aquaticum TaxID=1763816 RepID=UPI001F5D0BF4|nr:RNA polymerase sigma factor [Phenylobacterium aquaticum]